ncbi:MAG: ATP-binding protein [Campylobacterales bacterium]|nr:ATP-binding protein [Campylobacterales bacterium]
MLKQLTEALNTALKVEIESAKDVKPLKLFNLNRKEGGLYICTSPLKLEGEGILKINNTDYSVSIQTTNSIVVINGLEECETAVIREALLFQDQTALLQKVADEFEAFKPSELVESIFVAKKSTSNVPTTYKNHALKDAQNNVVNRGLNEEYLLVVGPAGTGKTTTIVALTDELLKQGKRVLVASHANLAVENVFKDMVDGNNFTEDELVLSIKTDMPSLKKYCLKAIGEEKAKPIKDELEVLEPALLKLAVIKKELLGIIDPADALIASNESFANNADREIRIIENDIVGLEDEKAGLEKRLAKLEENGLLATLSHLVSSDKKDELANQIAGIAKKIENKKSLLEEQKNKAKAFKDQVEKQVQDIAEAKEKLALINQEGKICKDRIELLKGELTDIVGQDFFKSAKLAGTTLMSVATNKKVREAGFDVLIVDEASMANLPMLLLAINCIKEKVVMFGDPMQLSPVAKKAPELKTSIFDVLGVSESFRNGEIHPKAAMLDQQFRCHPEIAALTSELFYNGLLKNERVMEDNKKAMYIKNTHGLGCNFKSQNGSFINERHQRIVLEQVKSALQKGQREIGVISPFRAQAEAIQSLFNLELAELYPDAKFKAATIHSFQGQQKDVVIFDFTFGQSLRGNGLPQMLLGDIVSEAAKLLNVATTRARDFFVLVCDLQYTHKVAEALPNCEDQAVIKWLKGIEKIAFAKNEEVKESTNIAA